MDNTKFFVLLNVMLMIGVFTVQITPLKIVLVTIQGIVVGMLLRELYR